LKRSYFLLLSIILLGSQTPAQNKDSITTALQPIVITAFRMPAYALHVSRTIDIIDERTIRNSGAVCVEELLQKGANVNIQPRGVFGVQSDVSVRGALFSQQLILLNGVRLNDVQTGHYNLDLPVSVEQIERVEVLKGAGSALYGPDACGGVINIITRIPEEEALRMKLSGGENGLLNASTGYDFSSSGIHSSNIIEHRQSNGYHYDTEFRITSISSNNKLELPIGTYSFFGGYTNKEFGAFNFYGVSPSKEWTETTFLSVATELNFPSFILQPKFSYRRHYDKFMYDLHTPNILVNIHKKNSYSGEILSIIQMGESFSLISGIEGTMDDIVSTNLRNHKRASLGMFVTTHGIVQKKIIVDVGIREDIHSEYGEQFDPSASLGYVFSQNSKVFVTAGRSFRAPSYIELFYTSPKRIGNANLNPETGWSYELGLDHTLYSQLQVTMSLFQRDQKNNIDYVKFTAADTVYKATNFASITTRGFELSFQWNNEAKSEYLQTDDASIHSILLSYTYLDSRMDLGHIYRTIYSLAYPRHQISTTISGILPLSISGTASAIHKIKLDGKNYTLVDAKISRMFSPVTLFLQGTNLLNRTYEEIIDVPLPGRWLWVGVEYRIF
jgi:vitamin B12 transporter